jgi:hypothetical protein
MQKFLALGFVLILLAGCGEEDYPIIGKWRGKITEEQRTGLLLPKGGEAGTLVAEFTKTIATLNGQKFQVLLKKNENTYYVNEIGTNRAMAIQFQEPDQIELGIPHRFKAEIVDLILNRVKSGQ